MSRVDGGAGGFPPSPGVPVRSFDPENPYAVLSEGCACCHPRDPEVLASLEMLAELLLTEDEAA